MTPSSASGESPFYLFHGRDPYLPTLQDLLGYKMRYLGDDKNGLMIDALHLLYQETMVNLVKSRQNTKMDIPVLRGDMFLGGLSLHLNHLIAERVSAPYRQFGTLPIGIFLSNLDSGQLETSFMTSYCHF